MNNKIAIFDFCSTLINFETGDRFIEFIIERINNPTLNKKLEKLQLLKTNFFLRVIRKFNRGFFAYKKSLLKLIAGLTKEQISSFAEQYYHDEIKPNVVSVTTNLIKELKEDDYHLVILSAGYSEYISLFAKDFGVDNVIANSFKYHDDIFTGKTMRKDCYGKEKKKRFLEQYKDYKKLICVSDSLSDLPIFNIANTKILVLKSGIDVNVSDDWRVLKWD